jgi:hypothetical protein
MVDLIQNALEYDTRHAEFYPNRPLHPSTCAIAISGPCFILPDPLSYRMFSLYQL